MSSDLLSSDYIYREAGTGQQNGTARDCSFSGTREGFIPLAPRFHANQRKRNEAAFPVRNTGAFFADCSRCPSLLTPELRRNVVGFSFLWGRMDQEDRAEKENR